MLVQNHSEPAASFRFHLLRDANFFNATQLSLLQRIGFASKVSSACEAGASIKPGS
jgi:hypothetical protein